jgi:predicted anti-sigma-YlaC factor YlaD
MTCKQLQDLLPDILANPGKFPEAEAHLQECADCREELEFLRELKEGIRVTMPDPNFTETVDQRFKALRRVRRERVKQPLIFVAAMAAVLALTLILPGVFTSESDPLFYANYEDETQELLMSIDVSAGFQVSMDEIAMYLLENADMETIKELNLENYQVKI